jgi:hypothetical protein
MTSTRRCTTETHQTNRVHCRKIRPVNSRANSPHSGLDRRTDTRHDSGWARRPDVHRSRPYRTHCQTHTTAPCRLRRYNSDLRIPLAGRRTHRRSPRDWRHSDHHSPRCRRRLAVSEPDGTADTCRTHPQSSPSRRKSGSNCTSHRCHTVVSTEPPCRGGNRDDIHRRPMSRYWHRRTPRLRHT